MPADIQSGVLASDTVSTVTFTSRYNYVVVKNDNATVDLWVTADGSTPSANEVGCTLVRPASDAVVANGLPMWWQGYGGPAGDGDDPGTTIKLIAAGTNEYSVQGLG